MKASLLFVAGLAIAISSIAPANAEATRVTTGATTSSFRSGNAPWVGCSVSAGWNFSSTCRNLSNFKSYNECTDGLAKGGRCHIIGEILVLLQSGVQGLKKITSRCAEAAPQSAASFISGPSPRCCFLAGADEVIELSDDFRCWPD
jgi:hypothetical protein